MCSYGPLDITKIGRTSGGDAQEDMKFITARVKVSNKGSYYFF
jgi:hypothetical protein